MSEEFEFEEGEEYYLDELPEMDSPSGKLELVGDGTLGAKYGVWILPMGRTTTVMLSH